MSRGGKREGAGRKPLPPKSKTSVVSVRIEQDIADWLKRNGGTEYHKKLLRKAFVENLIV